MIIRTEITYRRFFDTRYLIQARVNWFMEISYKPTRKELRLIDYFICPSGCIGHHEVVVVYFPRHRVSTLCYLPEYAFASLYAHLHLPGRYTISPLDNHTFYVLANNYCTSVWDPYQRQDFDTLEGINRQAVQLSATGHRGSDGWVPELYLT